MPGPRRFLASCLVASAAFATGCGDHKINVSKNEGASVNHGAVLFNERCSGCHSLDAADAFGSKPPGKVQGGERTDGPNFNVRKETREDVLYAIRNGGFSGAIMPANIVVGQNARDVAIFLERYAGAKSTAAPGSKTGK
ncbi:MAG TPA: c-type cytochrome [Thermoleophilaceae bacterium]|jgi:mono/diheme cytochrome c family protein